MSVLKWIHITTDMFDDEKIKLIEKMPDPDMILIIWIKLICQAGKVNDDGAIYITEELAYDEETLATVFNRPVNVIRLALTTFKKLGMVEIGDNGHIYLTNWEKHQNIQGLAKIREDTRKRVEKFRAKQKLKLLSIGNVTETKSNAQEEEEEEEEEEKKNIRGVPGGKERLIINLDEMENVEDVLLDEVLANGITLRGMLDRVQDESMRIIQRQACLSQIKTAGYEVYKAGVPYYVDGEKPKTECDV